MGRVMEQPSLIPDEPVERPLQVTDACPRCGGDRDKMLARLMDTVLRLRARLAKVDPDGEMF